MKKVPAGLAVLGASGAALAGTLSLAGPASARKPCQVIPKSPLVPHLVTPCAGTTIKAGTRSFTFTVYDVNATARQYAPYLNLRTNDKKSHGHLPADGTGNGIYDTLKRVPGHPGRWTYTSRDMNFPSYWLNHKGTYYVQVQQIDSRAGIGDTFYSPVVALHVS